MGVELRLLGCNPDRAEMRAIKHGFKVISKSQDKPHGLRECYIIDNEGLPLFFFPRILNYLLWLFKEIFNSNIATAKVIITDKIDPEIFTIKVSQNSDVGKATYANSITLTPGTVTTQIDKNTFEVHALNSDFGDDVRNGEMDKKVSWLEGKK